MRVSIPQGEDPTCLVRLIEEVTRVLSAHQSVTGVPINFDPPYEDQFARDLKVAPTALLRLHGLLGDDRIRT